MTDAGRVSPDPPLSGEVAGAAGGDTAAPPPSMHNPKSVKDIAKILSKIDFVSAIIYGVRRTGKTHLANSLLFEMSKRGVHYDVAYLFSETAWKLSQWKQIPKATRYDGFDGDVVRGILDAQRHLLEHNEEHEEIDQVTVPHVLIVLDDVNADRGIKWGDASDQLKRLYVQGRHSHISVITLLQHPKAVPPSVRSNADVVLMFRSTSALHRKSVVEDYCCCEPGRDAQKQAEAFYEAQFPNKHSCLCLMLCASAGCRKPSDYCFSTEAAAKEPPSYQLGDDTYWND